MIVSKQYRIPKELQDRFKAVTDKTGTTMNSTVCQLIAEYVYRMEQLGLGDVKEPTIIQVEEVKPKSRLRKPTKKK